MKYLVELSTVDPLDEHEVRVHELEAETLPLAVRDVEKMVMSRKWDRATLYEPVRVFEAVRAVDVVDAQGKPVKDRMDPAFVPDGNGAGGVDAVSGGLAGAGF